MQSIAICITGLSLLYGTFCIICTFGSLKYGNLNRMIEEVLFVYVIRFLSLIPLPVLLSKLVVIPEELPWLQYKMLALYIGQQVFAPYPVHGIRCAISLSTTPEQRMSELILLSCYKSKISFLVSNLIFSPFTNLVNIIDITTLLVIFSKHWSPKVLIMFKPSKFRRQVMVHLGGISGHVINRFRTSCMHNFLGTNRTISWKKKWSRLVSEKISKL